VTSVAKLLRSREKIGTLPSEVFQSDDSFRQSKKLALYHEETGHEAMGGKEEFARIKDRLIFHNKCSKCHKSISLGNTLTLPTGERVCSEECYTGALGERRRRDTGTKDDTVEKKQQAKREPQAATELGRQGGEVERGGSDTGFSRLLRATNQAARGEEGLGARDLMASQGLSLDMALALGQHAQEGSIQAKPDDIEETTARVQGAATEGTGEGDRTRKEVTFGEGLDGASGTNATAKPSVHDETKSERKGRLRNERAERQKGKEEWMKVRRMAFEHGGEHLELHRKQMDDDHAHHGKEEEGSCPLSRRSQKPGTLLPRMKWAPVETAGLKYG